MKRICRTIQAYWAHRDSCVSTVQYIEWMKKKRRSRIVIRLGLSKELEAREKIKMARKIKRGSKQSSFQHRWKIIQQIIANLFLSLINYSGECKMDSPLDLIAEIRNYLSYFWLTTAMLIASAVNFFSSSSFFLLNLPSIARNLSFGFRCYCFLSLRVISRSYFLKLNKYDQEEGAS